MIFFLSALLQDHEKDPLIYFLIRRLPPAPYLASNACRERVFV